jgi:hypothetical protein
MTRVLMGRLNWLTNKAVSSISGRTTKICGNGSTGFVVEGNVLGLAAFAFHPDIAHVVGVWCDTLGNLYIL